MNTIEWSARWWWVPVAALGLTACADGAGPSPRGRLALSVSTRAPTSSPSASTVLLAGDSTKIAVGADTVILRSADLVVREIELEQEGAQCENETGGPDPAPGSEEDGQESEDCAEFETGPLLVTLPLGAVPTAATVTVSAPAGEFDEFKFKIRIPGDDPASVAFLAANPAFVGVSVRVTGTLSRAGTRTEFTLLSDLEAKQTVTLDPPLTVAAGATANLTLRFDVSGWFLNAAGDALVDPATANAGGQNEALVEDNIRRSINAFEDDDHDGHDDEDPDDDPDGGTAG